MSKTANELKAQYVEAARALPIETKRRFWAAMLNGASLGEARDLVGIEDVMVAGELVVDLMNAAEVAGGMVVDELTGRPVGELDPEG